MRTSHTQLKRSWARMKVNGVSQAKQLRELLGRAFSAGNGSVVVTLPAAVNPDLMGPFGPRLDSTKHWVHPDAPEVFFRPSVHLLSFNAPEHEESGACRACGGTGIARRLLESALVPHPDRSMRDGAFAIWTEKNYKYVNVQHETIEGLRGMHGFSPEVPWSKLPASARALVLNGSGDELSLRPGAQRAGSSAPRARSPASGRSSWTSQLRERRSRTSLPPTSRPARAILAAAHDGRFKPAHCGSGVTALPKSSE